MMRARITRPQASFLGTGKTKVYWPASRPSIGSLGISSLITSLIPGSTFNVTLDPAFREHQSASVDGDELKVEVPADRYLYFGHVVPFPFVALCAEPMRLHPLPPLPPTLTDCAARIQRSLRPSVDRSVNELTHEERGRFGRCGTRRLLPPTGGLDDRRSWPRPELARDPDGQRERRDRRAVAPRYEVVASEAKSRSAAAWMTATSARRATLANSGPRSLVTSR
jgi:hypothetical protein